MHVHDWWFDDAGNVLCRRCPEIHLQGEYDYEEDESGRITHVIALK